MKIRLVSGRALIGALLSLGAFGTSSLAYPPPATAWSHACGGADPGPRAGFVGLAEYHPPADVAGLRVKLEYQDPTLCTTPGAASFSSAWIGIEGQDPNDPGYNIFQIGIDTCQNAACPSGATNGVPYYFWAYGHMASSNCGSAVAPVAHKAPMGNAANASYWFQIVRVDDPVYPYYSARIAGSTQVTKQVADIGPCWNGVDTAAYLDEVWDIFDQTPGSVSNSQFWSTATWDDGSGVIHAVNRPYSASCDVDDRTSQSCHVASNLHDSFYVYDTRQP